MTAQAKRISEPAHDPSPLAQVLEKNICTLIREREEKKKQSSLSERISDRISEFAGSMRFVYLHLLAFGGWMVYNTVAPRMGLNAFDPFPFGLLTGIASMEAIFVSTFVLITQNRMSAQAERRADLDVQISLLAEHEITALLRMVKQIHERLGITPAIPELSELEEDVSPRKVLEEIELTEQQLCSDGS